jgi:MSHA biogenesis protein MshL
MAVLLAAGCASSPPLQRNVDPDILKELDAASNQKRDQKKSQPAEAELLPPLRMEMPAVRGQPIDQRFDLSVSNAPAPQVFMSLVAGTRYSMLLNPNVGGTISVNLKDVTLREALQSIRELYGYEYTIDGSRIYIQPIAIQTRIFQVNYLVGQRIGRSDIRVTSGSVADAPLTATPGTPGAVGVPVQQVPGAVPGAPGTAAAGVNDSSRIQTQTRNDFWDDLDKTLKAIVGAEPGRSVVVNPQAGVVMVRAMPAELRNVEGYLKAIRLAVERQVVLEAKIIEVTLNGQYQTGVNWAAFSANHVSVGQVSPGTALQRPTVPGSITATGAASITGTTGNLTVTNPTFGSNPGSNLINFALPGASLFGLAIQASNFAALMTFLESQGSIQVLSSPRIATLNNQKAVLKVGTDQFFLTNISGSNTTTATTINGTTAPAFPTITLRPFFSGVALDITPQIDDNSNIILHIHPSVSVVQTDNRQIDLGVNFGGVVSLPVAKSDVSETDSVVKISDGAIVAIGGLMKVDLEDSRSGLPGAQDSATVGGLFGSRNRTLVKKELVILIKPTVIQSGTESVEDMQQARERIMDMMMNPAQAAPQKGAPAR